MDNYSIPEHIYINGKFVLNVDKLKVPNTTINKNTSLFTPVNWGSVSSSSKTQEQMYKYLFPFN